MPTVGQIRDAIVAKMNGIAGIGRVHGFERYAKREADFVALFKSTDKVLGWIVRRVATREISRIVGRSIVTHRWQIRGYMSLDDATQSEVAFDTLIEAVRDAFRADETLGGLIDDTVADGDVAGVQVDDSGPVFFGGVLCHGARLTLNTRHSQ